jgi:hypothetical protein
MTDAPEPPRPSLKLQTVNIDCTDAEEMAAFYGRLLGWSVSYRDHDFGLMRDPGGGTGLSFQAREDYVPPVWPEQPGAQDKMIHLDLRVDDLDPRSSTRWPRARVSPSTRAVRISGSCSTLPAILSASSPADDGCIGRAEEPGDEGPDRSGASAVGHNPSRRYVRCC